MHLCARFGVYSVLLCRNCAVICVGGDVLTCRLTCFRRVFNGVYMVFDLRRDTTGKCPFWRKMHTLLLATKPRRRFRLSESCARSEVLLSVCITLWWRTSELRVTFTCH